MRFTDPNLTKRAVDLRDGDVFDFDGERYTVDGGATDLYGVVEVPTRENITLEFTDTTVLPIYLEDQ